MFIERIEGVAVSKADSSPECMNDLLVLDAGPPIVVAGIPVQLMDMLILYAVNFVLPQETEEAADTASVAVVPLMLSVRSSTPVLCV